VAELVYFEEDLFTINRMKFLECLQIDGKRASGEDVVRSSGVDMMDK